MNFDADKGARPPADPGNIQAVTEQIVARLEQSDGAAPAEDVPADGPNATEYAAPDEAAEALADLSGEPLHDVTVDGRTQRVTLDELRKGYSRQQDYSRKTAALAEQRRAAETERNSLKDALDAIILDSETTDPVLAEGARTDWERLAAEEPERYARQRAEFDRRRERLAEAQAMRRAMAAKDDALRAEAFDAFASGQRQNLLRRMPELGDPAKRKAVAAELSAYAAELGFTDAEQARIVDHRLVQVFHDAMLHRKQQAARDRLSAKKVKHSSPTQAPAASREEGVRRSARLGALKRNAIRSGRVDDVVDSILAHLDEDQ